MPRVDTRATRERVLVLLDARQTEQQIRETIAASLGISASNIELTGVVRQVRSGREALLRPGMYRPRAAKKVKS